MKAGFDSARDEMTELPLAKAALFLDFDGTLAPITSTPRDIAPNPSRTELLRQACRKLCGRLAVVSGRSLDDVDRLIEGAAPCVTGTHGLQRRDAGGRVHAIEPHPKLLEAAELMDAYARAHSGIIVEHKGPSVALHYRKAPAATEAVHDFVRRLSTAMGLPIQEGRMVLELRSPGPDKGEAVRAYMSEPPFRGAKPVYIGDDQTDEAAFEAVARMDGFGVVVGERRPTRARFRLSAPPRVLDWLARSLDRGGFDPGGLQWAG